MNRFDKDIKWPLVDTMGLLGGTKSDLFRSAITDESLWLFWDRRAQVRLRSESSQLGLWYFVEMEREGRGGTSVIVNLNKAGVYKISVDASSGEPVELELSEKLEAVEYVREVLAQQLK